MAKRCSPCRKDRASRRGDRPSPARNAFPLYRERPLLREQRLRQTQPKPGVRSELHEIVAARRTATRATKPRLRRTQVEGSGTAGGATAPRAYTNLSSDPT